MPHTDQEIQIRSEEIQEVLSFVPNWMIRWGNTLIIILILGLLLISWFVKYPDVIVSEIIVTTGIPPEKVYAKNSGKLDAILVKENEEITKDKVMAIIENSSRYKDVLLLKNIIDTLIIDYTNFNFPLEKLPMLYLGDVEADFALFERNYMEYKLNEKLNPFSNELLANKLSISEARNRLYTLVAQQDINRSELDLMKKDLERYSYLYEKGVVSAQEYEQKQLENLQAEREYRNNVSSISQLKEVINNSQKNLRGTEIKKVQDDNRSLKSVIQSYNLLKKSLKKWELNYALASSIEGKVSFLSFWNKNQTVKQGDLVFTIIPKDYKYFIGKIKAPIQNSGKIKINQRVNIRLSNYPYEEFGMLEGIVKNVSLIPDKEGSYLIDVALPKKLVTTYKKEIAFKQEMRGSAEIITQDLRLIERFFYQLKRVFDK